jgi:hypothetical protein
MKWFTVLVIAIAVATAILAALLFAAGGSDGEELPPRQAGWGVGS